MRALLTGATGFVGSALARALLDKGEVHCLVRPTSNLWRIVDIKDRLMLHEGDLLDQDSLEKAFSAAKPDVVFHLGAYGTYPKHKSDPAKILEATTLGSYRVFSLAKKYGAKVVSAGSSSEYGTKDHPMREDEMIEPNSIYAVGKSAQALLGQHLAREEGIPIVTLRLFSVYGPFEEPGRLMPTLIGNALEEKEIKLAEAKIARDFIYINDVVQAFIAAGESDDLAGEIINIGSGEQHTLKEIFDEVIRATGSASKAVIGAYEKRAFDTDIWVADTEKMRTRLKFKPKVPLAEGIKNMVKWFPRFAHVYQTQ